MVNLVQVEEDCANKEPARFVKPEKALMCAGYALFKLSEYQLKLYMHTLYVIRNY